MRLNEALKNCSPDKFLKRKKWITDGINMTLISSSKDIELLDISLTEESLNASDWEIVDNK